MRQVRLVIDFPPQDEPIAEKNPWEGIEQGLSQQDSH